MADIIIRTMEEEDGVVFEEDEALEPLGFQMTETEDEIDLTANVSGFDEDEIEVVFDRGNLTVTGYHDEVEGEEDDVEGEESYIGFSDSFALPEGIGPSQIAADLDDEGTLTIVIHKSPQPFSGAQA